MKPISCDDYPYTFDPEACKDCPGRCCTGESGNVWITPVEIETLAALLGINEFDFMQQYLRRVGNRWSLAERVGDEQLICIFFDETTRQCSVYSARPEQCRTFPFWEYFRKHVDELLSECPGVKLTRNKSDQV